MIKFKQEEIDNEINCLKALQSQTVLASCLSTVKRELSKWNITDAEIDIQKGYNSKYLCANIIIIDNELYDMLMNDSRTHIADTKNITCNINIEQVLVDYNISLKININIRCDLPEQDLYTLRTIGKIHYNPPFIGLGHESVVC